MTAGKVERDNDLVPVQPLTHAELFTEVAPFMTTNVSLNFSCNSRCHLEETLFDRALVKCSEAVGDNCPSQLGCAVAFLGDALSETWDVHLGFLPLRLGTAIVSGREAIGPALNSTYDHHNWAIVLRGEITCCLLQQTTITTACPESGRSPDLENGVRGVHRRPNRVMVTLVFLMALPVSD